MNNPSGTKRNPWNSPQRNITPKTTADAVTPKDNRKKAQKHKERARCVCDNKECDHLMDKLKKLNKDMHVYFNVPEPPKYMPPEEVKGLRKPTRENRIDQQKKHDCFVTALGTNAKRRVALYLSSKDQGEGIDQREVYSPETKPQFASIHVHPDILLLTTLTSNNRRMLPKSIPRALGLKLKRDGFNFEKKDEVPSSPSNDYFALPNYPIDKAQADISVLQTEVIAAERVATIRTIPTSAMTRSGSSVSSNPYSYEMDMCCVERSKQRR